VLPKTDAKTREQLLRSRVQDWSSAALVKVADFALLQAWPLTLEVLTFVGHGRCRFGAQESILAGLQERSSSARPSAEACYDLLIRQPGYPHSRFLWSARPRPIYRFLARRDHWSATGFNSLVWHRFLFSAQALMLDVPDRGQYTTALQIALRLCLVYARHHNAEAFVTAAVEAGHVTADDGQWIIHSWRHKPEATVKMAGDLQFVKPCYDQPNYPWLNPRTCSIFPWTEVCIFDESTAV